MTVTIKGHIRVPVEALETIKMHLPAHIQNTLNEPGCLIFQVQQDALDACLFHVSEKFEDERALDAHQNRVKSSQWGAVTKNVERVYEKFE